jgi:alkylation response protein AidB-like acyl-CoA dehydrogenase
MDFTFSKEHVALRRLVHEVAEEELRPVARQVDHEGRIPERTISLLGELGLMGVPFPRKYGGIEAGMVGLCITVEEIYRVCPSTAVMVGVHTGLGAMSLYLDGNEQQKQKYLLPLTSGKNIAAFALTEPSAGSDAAALRTRATRQDGVYLLNGSKIYISNGPIADMVVTLAVTDPTLGIRGGVTAFIVETEWKGFKVGTIEHKLGIRGSQTSELIYDQVEVPEENILGRLGMGYGLFLRSLDHGRLTIGAAGLGGARAALQAATRWAKTRQQFGRYIAQNQSIQWMIADMDTEIEALRLMIYRTAWLVDQGKPFGKEAAACKLYGSEVASRCIDRAIQIHGGLGLSRDFPLEQAFRDARISEIFEGTNEIQRIVIAGHLFREHGVKIRP